MWGMILPLLSQIPGVVGESFKRMAEVQAARVEADRQIEVARQQLAGEIAKSQADLLVTVVASTSPKFKYFTFFMWFGPFMIGLVFPEYAATIFHNLGVMPEWYVTSCMTIMFTVWGIAVSQPIVSNIFSGVSNFFAARREYKLEKARIDRKSFYDALRKIKGAVSGADVKALEPVLDELDKEVKGKDAQ